MAGITKIRIKFMSIQVVHIYVELQSNKMKLKVFPAVIAGMLLFASCPPFLYTANVFPTRITDIPCELHVP